MCLPEFHMLIGYQLTKYIVNGKKMECVMRYTKMQAGNQSAWNIMLESKSKTQLNVLDIQLDREMS